MFDYDPEAIAAILGTSLDAVFTIDERGRIVDTNAAATRLFGWQREALGLQPKKPYGGGT